jgi:hypothetical protein
MFRLDHIQKFVEARLCGIIHTVLFVLGVLLKHLFFLTLQLSEFGLQSLLPVGACLLYILQLLLIDLPTVLQLFVLSLRPLEVVRELVLGLH